KRPDVARRAGRGDGRLAPRRDLGVGHVGARLVRVDVKDDLGRRAAPREERGPSDEETAPRHHPRRRRRRMIAATAAPSDARAGHPAASAPAGRHPPPLDDPLPPVPASSPGVAPPLLEPPPSPAPPALLPLDPPLLAPPSGGVSYGPVPAPVVVDSNAPTSFAV